MNTHNDFKNLELLIAIPEFKVPLPGGSRPSQNDIFFLASSSNGLFSFAVEAKAKEDFDKTISEWLIDSSQGKKKRLEYLCNEINIPSSNIKKLRYQLFHRLASSIIMAKKFHAKYAVMIILSFINEDTHNHYDDFQNFVEAYDVLSSKDIPLKLTEIDDIQVYAIPMCQHS